MSKILAIADVHIHDYSSRNPSEKFRLHQSRTIAYNIISVAKKEGADIIVLAGDIIEKSLVRSYIQSEVKNFLDTIMKYFKIGYIIYGNHDQDNRSTYQDISDSCLGVMLPSNLYYAHQRIVNIGNLSIGFCNWMPTFDLTWISDKVNILFTHARICYASSEGGEDLFESQELDESKFDLAICGDIHKKASIGKYVSIGPTQRCKMGDSEESSGVILDCDTGNWKWVDLNPEDNLMKFKYTDSPDLEGWSESEGIWYVYKQNNLGLIGESKNIKVSRWEEISQLINEAVIKSGAGNVHSKVLSHIKNEDSGEVDFNFTLLGFRCKNWRSIDEASLDFKDHDKILIQGDNGSGKSSLLSAIKYAFVDVGDTVGLSSLKPFIQFGAKECMTEVEFLYQENIYKIRRGTKEFGLWINGEPQKYGDKRSFEKELRERFPFIKYMSSFFFDATHNEYIGSLNPEQLMEVVSKFLKLDRIDTYNEAAKEISELIRKDLLVNTTKLGEIEKVISYIDSKLSSMSIPDMKKEELIKLRDEGLQIQRQHELWEEESKKIIRLESELDALQSNLLHSKNLQAGYRSLSVVDSDIDNLNELLRQILSGSIVKSLEEQIMKLDREEQELRTKGNNAWLEGQSIVEGKKCKTCGQIIYLSEEAKLRKIELGNIVSEVKNRLDKLISEKNDLKEQLKPLKTEQEKTIQELSNQLNSVMSEKAEIRKVEEDITRYEGLIKSKRTFLTNLQSTLPPKVDLPENFMERMANLNSGIHAWEDYESVLADRNSKLVEKINFEHNIEEIQAEALEFENYIKLTGPTGIIYEEIINKLKNQFSDETVKYEVERKGKGTREHLYLIPQYIVGDNLVDYSAASTGQKTILDIHFLSKIVTRLGLLVLDEFLKHLSQENTELCLELLGAMNIGCLMVSSHMDVSGFNNKYLKTELNDNGITKIEYGK